MTNNPMHLAPRCGAHARTTGFACQAPAMANGRCRMHGGSSTGAPIGNAHARKHGLRSATVMAWRMAVNEIMRENREMVAEMMR